MSSSRHRRESLAPSLFPFLAVLLCTMGALVVILMLVVAGAQASTQAAAQETHKRIEENEALLEMAKRSYQNQLTEGRIALEKKRLVLQHLETHINELLDELDDLKRTADLIANEKTTEANVVADRRAELSALEKQLAEATEELNKKIEKPDGDKPIFAIIPYQGNNGTHRRPIYVECTADGITIQPEGVRLMPNDLMPPYGPGNPLDAALRTIRAEFPPSNGAVTSTAYPLLVVRPSGIHAYVLARAAMSGWDDQFGYELIDEELELAFPESTPGLKAKLVKALDLARDRQAALVMAMPQQYRGYDSARTEERNDDWEVDSANAIPGSLAAGSNASLLAGDGPNLNRGGFTFDQSGSSRQAGGTGYGTNETEMGFSSLTSGNNNEPAFTTGSGLDESLSGGAYAANGSRQASMSANSLFENGSTDLQAGNGFDGPASDGDASSEHGANTSSNSSRRPTGAFQPTQAASNGELAGASENVGITTAGSGNSNSASGTNGGSASGGSPTPSMQAGGQTASSETSADSQNQNSTASPLSYNSQLNRQPETTRPVARARGRNWAWSQGPPTETPVVRSIRVQCLNDRWLVLPDSGSSKTPLTVSFESTPRERAEQLAKIVLERVDSWGIALTGGHWKPVLLVEVAPDAEWRFEQLKQLLDGSGLEIQRRTAE